MTSKATSATAQVKWALLNEKVMDKIEEKEDQRQSFFKSAPKKAVDKRVLKTFVKITHWIIINSLSHRELKAKRTIQVHLY